MAMQHAPPPCIAVAQGASDKVASDRADAEALMTRARAKLDAVHRSAAKLAEAHGRDLADLAERERALADARSEVEARAAEQVRHCCVCCDSTAG